MKIWHLLALGALLFNGFITGTAQAAPTIETKAKQAIVVDMATGTVLFDKNAHEKMYPASMTKLMTAHIVFDYLKQGRLTMEDTLPVSEKAWRMGGSKMFVKVDTRVSVSDLLKGIIIQSGNDACLVVAEGISGSEEQFAQLMNRYAKELGMTQTHFKNSTGWPDEEHVTSPYDLYLLARDTIQNYPEYYPLYAEKEYFYNGIRQPNRNLLLDSGLGVDGLKTGHTEAAGYGITISGVNAEDGRRIIVVVNGLSSEKERADEAERLLIFAYRNFENRTLWSAGEEVAQADVWLGVKPTVPLVVAEDLHLTLPKKVDKDSITMKVVYSGPLEAPVAKGAEVGKLILAVEGQQERTIPLLAGEDVAELTAFGRIVPALKHYLAP